MGCAVPVIGAPMLGCSDIRLARAVAGAGGVGSVPCSGMPAEKLRTLLRESAGTPVCWNFFCHSQPPAGATVSPAWLGRLAAYFAREGIADPAAVVQRRLDALQPTTFSAAQLAVLLEAAASLPSAARSPVLVSFHFGLPPPALWEPLRAARPPLCVCASATTVAEAVHLRERGVDVVVCQGAEAGGHRGLFLPESRVETQVGTFALVPQVRAALGPSACVVAAGGVVDAATARAAVVLGADGVQVGTALLRTPEATTSAVHRAALAAAASTSASATATSITNVQSGRPARGLQNRVMADLGSMCGDAPPYPLCQVYLADLRAAAEADGRGDYTSCWAGQNVSGGCTDGAAADKVRAIAAAFA